MSSKVSYKAPLYLQLREVIRGKIEEGEYPPGCAIPSESQLAEIYGINRLTVRNAVDALVTEGLLRRVQGKGVYVVGERVERNLDSLRGFRQTMREHHSKPFVRSLAKLKRPAGVFYASVFDCDSHDDLIYIKRLNGADEEPVSIEETMVPLKLLPELENVDISVFSLYDDIYGFYGIRLTRAVETLDLVRPDQKDSRLLGLEPGGAALLFTCTSYDSEGRVIEFNRAYTRGDTSRYSITIGSV